MPVDIKIAKRELFEQLKQHEEVVGAVIRDLGEGNSIIVVFLSDFGNFADYHFKFPSKFLGYNVIYELSGEIKPL